MVFHMSSRFSPGDFCERIEPYCPRLPSCVMNWHNPLLPTLTHASSLHHPKDHSWEERENSHSNHFSVFCSSHEVCQLRKNGLLTTENGWTLVSQWQPEVEDLTNKGKQFGLGRQVRTWALWSSELNANLIYATYRLWLNFYKLACKD